MYNKLNNRKIFSSFTIAKYPFNSNEVKRKIGHIVSNYFSYIDLIIYKTFFLSKNNTSSFIFKDIFYKMFLKKKMDAHFSSKIIDPKGFLSYEKTYEVSGNDIVQGLPKLESLLESSIEPANTDSIEFSLGLSFGRGKSAFIRSSEIYFNDNCIETKVFVPKYNLKERKDPEISCWFYYTEISTKRSLEKTLFYNRIKLKTFVVNSLQRIYKEQNITVARKIFETAINVMFSRILIINPLYNPFLYNETINYKIYLKIIKTTKRLKKLPLIGLPIIDGISKSVKESNRLLSSLSFKDTLNDLTKRTLFGSKDWLTSTKSNLILSQRIKIGSNLKNKTEIYFSTKDLILKNKYFD